MRVNVLIFILKKKKKKPENRKFSKVTWVSIQYKNLGFHVTHAVSYQMFKRVSHARAHGNTG